jgi:hypothetical protein
VSSPDCASAGGSGDFVGEGKLKNHAIAGGESPPRRGPIWPQAAKAGRATSDFCRARVHRA